MGTSTKPGRGRAVSGREGAAPTPGRRGRPRDSAKTEAILTAATRLFMERGLDATSMDAIAEAAGVSKATIYARFAVKEDLLRAAIQAKCSEFLDAPTLETPSRRSVRLGLATMSRRFLELLVDADAVAMLRLIMQEGERHPHLRLLFFESAILPTFHRFVSYLEAEVSRGHLAIADIPAATWRLLGMVKGQDQIRAMLGLPRRPDAEIEGHIEACVHDFLMVHRPPTTE
jgi:TetR/AcrR family transcriptional repressor of mexJK operon